MLLKMRKKCNVKCKFIYDIDLFGKEAELYYKGKSKRTSLAGIIFTIIYIGMYIAFFIYKVIRMIQKVDVTFYETYAFNGEPPYLKLSKDKFYGGFALGNPLTLQTFVDDGIYFVKAYYRRGVKEGTTWKWETIPLEIETCQLDKFGEEYRDIFEDKAVDQLHCVPVLDQILQGHLTYDVYSYFLVRFFPCIEGVNSDNCKPLSLVKQYLTQTFVTFKMEDVDLTPQIYNSPVTLRGKEVSANVGSSLFQDVHSFFQIINIETDEDILGFEGLSQIKKEKYIKYDNSVILSRLKEDIFVTGDSICDITIALSERELTQKRTYPKLMEVLGDVGGLMEVFFLFFRIISSFLNETLYETSLVNHLFSFDLRKKVLIIKELEKQTSFKNLEDSPKIYIPTQNVSKITQKNIILNSKDEAIQSNNKLNEECLSKSQLYNEKILINKPKKKRKKKIKIKIKKGSKTREKYEDNKMIKNEKDSMQFNGEEYKASEINNCNSIEDKDTKKDNQNMDTQNGSQIISENMTIIHKIENNKFCTYFCFLCVRKRKNIQNVLLDEGMKIITEKLDLMNIFKKIYRDEKLQEKENISNVIIEMSEECKKNLMIVNKK